MEPDKVVRLRLQSQLLREPAADSPEAALRKLLAVQAQEFPYARWSLAQRVSGTADPPVTAVIDGVVFYFAAEADPETLIAGLGRQVADAGPRVDLIQCYDEYIMGYSATRHYLGGTAPVFPSGDKLDRHTREAQHREQPVFLDHHPVTPDPGGHADVPEIRGPPES